jgi:hypothetical protein
MYALGEASAKVYLDGNEKGDTSIHMLEYRRKYHENDAAYMYKRNLGLYSGNYFQTIPECG